MISYTPKESKVINSAWTDLKDHASRHAGLGGEGQVAAILKEARREVRGSEASLLTVKAKLLGSLADAAETAPEELWPFLRSHRDIIAYSWCHRETLVDKGVMYAARQASDAHGRAAARARHAVDIP